MRAHVVQFFKYMRATKNENRKSMQCSHSAIDIYCPIVKKTPAIKKITFDF